MFFSCITLHAPTAETKRVRPKMAVFDPLPGEGGGAKKRRKKRKELGLLLFICQIVPSRFKGLYVVLCKVYNQTRILKKVLTIF